MLRNYLWDFDGTLVDTYPAISNAFSQALGELGISVEFDHIDRLARTSLSLCVQTFSQQHGVPPEAIEEGFSKHYRSTPPGKQALFPQAVAVCQMAPARQGVNVIVTHRGVASCRKILEAHAIEGLFADIISSQEGYPRKPDPGMVLEALARHKLAAAETLMIGDRALDIQSGQAAGVATCLFGDAELTQAADYHIHAYAELIEMLSHDQE